MLVMVQREVAERLAAHAGDTGLRRGLGEGGLLGHGRGGGQGPGQRLRAPTERRVGARGDRPPARRPRWIPAVVEPGDLFALVRAGFGQRRKMLRRALAGVVGAGCLRRRRRSTRQPGPRSSTSPAWGRLAAMPPAA